MINKYKHPYEQKHLRIRLSIWAFAYEYLDHSLVDDFYYDEMAKLVDVSVRTDRPDLDEWFRKNYSDFTGSWVGGHPEIERLEELTRGIINAKAERRRNTTGVRQ